MAAFELSVRWIDGAVELATDDRMREGGHLSVASTGDLTVVVFGRLLDRASLETVHGLAAGPRGEPSRTDAEIAGDLYRAVGTGWLADASGDYAVALYDGAARRLLLARNHVGTRPIFFRVVDGGVRVGSDFASAGSTGELLDDVAVARFLAGYPPESGRCLPADVSTVAPAHVTTITPEATTSERYWDPRACPRLAYRSIDEAAPALRELLREVVTEVVDRVEEPIGMHLTGGIDSATVGAFAVARRVDAGTPPPYAYSWQAPADPGDEPTLDQHLIDVLAGQLGIDVRAQVADVDVVRHVLGHDPVRAPVTSTLALEYPVMAAAEHDGVSWILSGWGGDEIVSYNGRRRPQRMVGRTKSTIKRLTGRRSTRAGFGRRPHGFANARVIAAWSRPEPRREASARAQQIQQLEAGHLSERTDSWSVFGVGFGLQHAYPLLDRRVVEFVLGLPGACFPHGRELMREVLRGVVPDEVRLNRNKDEPGRWNHSRHTVDRAVRAEGGDVRVRPSRLSYLDVETLRAAVTAPDIQHPGKLTLALQFAHDPDGVPLSALAGVSGNGSARPG